jgi:hypothetical protein
VLLFENPVYNFNISSLDICVKKMYEFDVIHILKKQQQIMKKFNTIMIFENKQLKDKKKHNLDDVI